MYENKSPLDRAKKPASKDWHRADIIAAVRKTGTNLQQLSRAHHLGRTTLSNALYGPCPRYERLIAEHLNTTPQTIWPSRYHADGSPKSGRGERGVGRYKTRNNRNDTSHEKSCNGYSASQAGSKETMNGKRSQPGSVREFDKHMALDVMEDALTDIDTPHGLGMATGLCSAFYMCGLFSAEEWEALLERIPTNSRVDPLAAQSPGMQ